MTIAGATIGSVAMIVLALLGTTTWLAIAGGFMVAFTVTFMTWPDDDES